MDEKELNFILQEGEGLKIEFKEGISGIDKEIVAFANSEGGRIFVGITDNSIIKGIKITNKLKSQIQDIARNCDPGVEVKLEEINKKILVINVNEGKNKPYKCSSGFYLRQGPNSQRMNRDEIINLSVNIGKIKFDEQINNDFVYPNDFDKTKLNNYLSLAKISKIISNEKIFTELHVIKKIKL